MVDPDEGHWIASSYFSEGKKVPKEKGTTVDQGNKPATTKGDGGNGEPQRADLSKTLNNINNGFGAAGVVPSTVEAGIKLIQQTTTAPIADDFVKVGKVASKTSVGLGVAGMFVTALDGGLTGWKNHHTADFIIGGAQTFLLGSGPVGWGIDYYGR